MRRVLRFSLIIALLALISCKTRYVTEQVPVVVEHTTDKTHTEWRTDTLTIKDSVYHYVMGDTVIIEKWHNVVNINKVMVSDTIRDTVPVVTEVVRTEVREVNHLKWWQTSLMWFGVVALCILAAPHAFSLAKRLLGK